MLAKRLFFFSIALLFCFSFVVSATAALEKGTFYHGSREEKKVALTFDDGPHPRYTKEILRILDKYGVAATFFVVGENVELYQDAAHQLFRSAHEIGIHTYSHPHMTEITAEMLKKEILKTETVIFAHGGRASRIFRPPEGKKSAEHAALLEQMGYRTVLWSIDTRDWAHNAPSVICKTVLSGVKGGDILLFHDFVVSPNTTITALEQLIPRLQKSGYEFVTVSELLGL